MADPRLRHIAVLFPWLWLGSVKVHLLALSKSDKIGGPRSWPATGEGKSLGLGLGAVHDTPLV